MTNNPILTNASAPVAKADFLLRDILLAYLAADLKTFPSSNRQFRITRVAAGKSCAEPMAGGCDALCRI